MNNQIFKTIELPKLPSNRFDLTHDVKMSMAFGELTPNLVIECVPGDEFKLSCDIFTRLAPMIAPIMHRVDVTQHYFFVPNRILWENFESWIVNEAGPVYPQITVNNTVTSDQERFMDYMGVPPFSQNTGGQAVDISALPFAAYQMIYNEYYRDQNLVTTNIWAGPLADGINSRTELCKIRKRAWEHDYLTSALPFAQKGAAVDLPLGQVTLDPLWNASGSVPVFYDPAGLVIGGNLDNSVGGVTVAGGVTPNAYDPDGSLVVGATTINDFRRAEKLQQWLELNARGGTRYIENILVHFRKRSSDARLQRPEYITGSKSPVIISEVLNTTGGFDPNNPTDPTSPPQGSMAGHGISVGKGYQGRYSVEEHGWIIGIISIMPKTAYQQGIPKHYLKNDPFQLYWPSFANIGEQEITNDEVYAYEVNGSSTFGYTPRYAEYKFMQSRVAGEFRTSLDFWHLGRIFSTPPTLSQEFIECDPDEVDRIFAVSNDEVNNVYVHILHIIQAERLMPVYGTPYL